MTINNKPIALKRDNEIICADCLFDFYESAVWADPQNETRLAKEHNISLINAETLHNNPSLKCSRCGKKIV